ncbi:MAG TPA: HAD hydrolase family protein [Gemmatimonadaceae bacterium]
MSFYFHGVAVDYDGTLTEGRRPDDRVLGAVRAVRSAGRRCVLVTGRILDELRADFSDAHEHFDAVVGENGAVLWLPGFDDRTLAAAVDPSLEHALRARGVAVRRGHAILAADAVHGDVVYEEIARLGLEAQIVRNRAALMVLPFGVTKGTGVTQALDELGISRHGTVAIGDAENDHSLLDACEVGVAVSNAVPALKSRADLVLRDADGAGIADFLLGPFLEGLPGLALRHWCLTVGRDADGAPLSIPASGVNLEIYGASGAGKSYVAGLIAEQLLEMRYIVCVIDVEGDHVPLGDMHGVVSLGGVHSLPEPSEAAGLLAEGMSVIVDLSMASDGTKRAYSAAMLDALRGTRERHGLPHWIVVEEAHIPMPAEREGWWCRDTRQAGFCLVSYRPELVCRHLTARADIVITLESPTRATLSRRGEAGTRRFVPSARAVPHVRHWHKYAEGTLPTPRHFHFRDARGLTGQTAGNIPEFVAVVRHAGEGVLRHHASGQDFSRWLGDLRRDRRLLESVRAAERALAGDRSSDAAAAFRAELARLAEGHADCGEVSRASARSDREQHAV